MAKHNARLTTLERRRAQRKPPPDIWVYTRNGRDACQDDTIARNSSTGELRPVADLPPDCVRIVVEYVEVP